MALPSGPTLHPMVQVVRWIRDPFLVMDECQARFGDTFTLRIPPIRGGYGRLSRTPTTSRRSSPSAPDEGHAGKANFILKPFVGKHSLLLLDGAEHLRQRKMMLPAFHGERMTAYGQAMLDLAHDSIDQLADRQELRRSPPDAGDHAAGHRSHRLRRRRGTALRGARRRPDAHARRGRMAGSPLSLHAA